MSSSENAVQEGDVLWSPSEEKNRRSTLHAYQQFLKASRGLQFADYHALRRWSLDELDDFWRSIVQFFDVPHEGSLEPVLASREMPGAQWFPYVRLNFVDQVFRHVGSSTPALIVKPEGGLAHQVSWEELRDQVGALAATLRRLGVRSGDRVVSYLNNRQETVVAFLACASIGAVWSACAAEMGTRVVIDRFVQIEPKVLLATDSYSYAGKVHNREPLVAELLTALPTIEHVIHVPGPGSAGAPSWRHCMSWDDAVKEAAPLEVVRLPFDHPLWIVYSSGTTGLPKAMVHGHGGAVITILKTLGIQTDLRPGDRKLMTASTGWIVWNLLISSMLCGATAVLYDGHPSWPNSETLWDFIDDQEVTMFGCGAAHLINSMKDKLEPGKTRPFKALRTLLSAGSPLPLDAYEWVYRSVKSDLWLTSPSGGTDIIGAFVSSAPTLPVTAGEIQCAELGVDVCAFDEHGKPVIGEVGELVVRQPMPSMPLYFWNDPTEDGQMSRPGLAGRRYKESYFEMYPGVWRHGDWIRFTDRGTCVIYGRSDTTINRFGIRMGTAEIYRVVEEIPQVRDSLVVDLEYRGRPSFMPLFVVLSAGVELDDALRQRIVQQIRQFASPRHVPDEIVVVPEIPRTLTGKKMELPVRKLLLGAKPEAVASPDAMSNPDSLQTFIAYAARRASVVTEG
jgi:acetoacetyl-CoA synthetase